MVTIHEVGKSDLLIHEGTRCPLKVISLSGGYAQISVSGSNVILTRPLVRLKKILDKCRKVGQKEYDQHVKRKYEVSDDFGQQVTDLIKEIV